MSRKELIVRSLPPKDLEAWDKLAAVHGSIFDSVKWTDVFGSSLRRLGIYNAGGDLRGGFYAWEQHRFGLRILRNPPYTPQIGPFFESRASNPAARTDEQRLIVEAMADYLSSPGAAVVSLCLSQGVTDCLPFYWRGWKVAPHYTYHIDLTVDEDHLFAAMSNERRKNMRKALADDIQVEETVDPIVMSGLVVETFARHQKAFANHVMEKILRSYLPGENSYCLVSREKSRVVAGVCIIHDSRTAYYLMGGYTDGAHHGAGPLAMWHAILKAKSLGLKVFDFEGSSVPSIERYFRGFGGKLTSSFDVHKAWLPLEMVLKLRYRTQF